MDLFSRLAALLAMSSCVACGGATSDNDSEALVAAGSGGGGGSTAAASPGGSSAEMQVGGTSSAGTQAISCGLSGCPPQNRWVEYSDGTCACLACPNGQLACDGPAASGCAPLSTDVDDDGCCSCGGVALAAGAIWRPTSTSLELRHTSGSTMPGYETAVTTSCAVLATESLSAEQLTQFAALELIASNGSCIDDAVDYYTLTIYDLDGSFASYSSDGCESAGSSYVLDAAAIASLSMTGATICSD